ncbi:hypothetical protein BMS3Bbin04_01894 [bacterium BMS3Bbin04]|nr:hypothetical protein BMS3Bbin04_01894 [bacterium BMS3Bbin04]
MFRLAFINKNTLTNIPRIITLIVIICILYSCMGDVEDNSDIDITEEAMEFADLHFTAFRYSEYEYQIAILVNAGKEIYYGTIDDWQALEWHTRQMYLPDCFVQELPLNSDHIYYELIGTLSEQYGYGWDDETHEGSGNCWNGDSGNLDTYRAMIGL